MMRVEDLRFEDLTAVLIPAAVHEQVGFRAHDLLRNRIVRFVEREVGQPLVHHRQVVRGERPPARPSSLQDVVVRVTVVPPQPLAHREGVVARVEVPREIEVGPLVDDRCDREAAGSAGHSTRLVGGAHDLRIRLGSLGSPLEVDVPPPDPLVQIEEEILADQPFVQRLESILNAGVVVRAPPEFDDGCRRDLVILLRAEDAPHAVVDRAANAGRVLDSVIAGILRNRRGAVVRSDAIRSGAE